MNEGNCPVSEETHDIQDVVDRLADRFEKSWNSGQCLSLESFLDSVRDEEKAHVFRELITIEFELIMKQGKHPDLEEYRIRFAKFSDILEQVHQSLTDRHTLGNYELLEQIAKGGMGIIYRARHLLLDKTVAIKVMPDSFLCDENALTRFQREMKLIGSLDHPNIIRAFGAEKVEMKDGVSSLVLAMEYIKGCNLKQIVRTEGPLSAVQALNIVHQVALALQQAEQRGIVHRDIKPENIMVSDAGEIKVLDFGLGKFTDDYMTDDSGENQLTVMGSPLGTLDYLAPEQWESPGSVDIRSDVYGLGCTLFFLLSGYAPYDSIKYPTKREKMLAHLTKPFPRLQEYDISAPVELEELLAKMTAKDRERRHENMTELIREIQSVLSYAGQYDDVSVQPAQRRKNDVSRRFDNAKVALIGGAAISLLLGFIFFHRNPQGNTAGGVSPPIIPAFVANTIPDRQTPLSNADSLNATRWRHVDLRTARRVAREKLDEIESQIRSDKIPIASHPRKAELVELCERLADCTLYHGHAIGTKYEFYREEADELYRQAAKWSDDPSQAMILRCKHALLELLSGEPDSGTKRLAALVSDVSRRREENGSHDPAELIDKESISTDVFLETVQAIADFYHAASPVEGRKSLRTVLNAFRLNSDSANRCRGERLDLQLLCIRLLLESALEDRANDEAKADVAQYLDPILLGTLASDAEIRPFLRYFYDLALRCRDRDELLQLAEYIRCERMVAARSNDATHLIFYFDARSGFLIVLPKDHHLAERFDLPYTRSDIWDALADKKSLTLTDEVMKRIETEQKADRRIDLSWSDKICYLREGEGFDATDWPFEAQLDLERLCGIVK